jgi:hypothetical protein
MYMIRKKGNKRASSHQASPDPFHARLGEWFAARTNSKEKEMNT